MRKKGKKAPITNPPLLHHKINPISGNKISTRIEYHHTLDRTAPPAEPSPITTNLKVSPAHSPLQNIKETFFGFSTLCFPHTTLSDPPGKSPLRIYGLVIKGGGG